jgi:hypothetical protein
VNKTIVDEKGRGLADLSERKRQLLGRLDQLLRAKVWPSRKLRNRVDA